METIVQELIDKLSENLRLNLNEAEINYLRANLEALYIKGSLEGIEKMKAVIWEK